MRPGSSDAASGHRALAVRLSLISSNLLRSIFLKPAASDMPYGVVMASGGAGAVAASCGLHATAVALTGIAILQAVLLPAAALSARGGVPLPEWRFGLFTIALGLAVIGGNLQSLAPSCGDAVLAMAWSATLVLGGWRIVLAFRPAGSAEIVDGSWFLAPAALLADAFATAARARPEWTVRLVVVACLAGVAGYAVVIAASALRLRRRGLSGSPLAPWWIAAGCGGLAAAAAGQVAGRVPAGALHQVLHGLVVATWAIGTVLLVVVLIGCAVHACRRAHGAWHHLWTPVFSMAVYAAGTDRLARLSDAGSLQQFALITIAATLLLWVVNSALCLWRGGATGRIPPAVGPDFT